VCDNDETSILPYAKAAEKVAEFGTEALKTLNNLGDYAAWVVGDAPKDFFGRVIGDRLKLSRAVNILKIVQRHQEILQERGIEGKTEPISNNIAIPLFEAAQDESRPELQELWARLIANAMDPERSSAVRRSIIETVKAFEPLDALILEFGYKMEFVDINGIMPKFRVQQDEAEVSIEHLLNLRCIGSDYRLSFFGREIMRACSPSKEEK
jgi:hypothetical protein